MVSAAPTRGTRHVKESLPAVTAFYLSATRKATPRARASPVMSTTSSAFPPNPSPPPGDDNDGGAGAPSSQLAVFVGTFARARSAPTLRFAPTPDASSSREARSPMTRSGATAGGRCVFGVRVFAFTRARPLEKKTSRSLKRHANEVRTRLRSGACRVSGRPIPVC